MTSSTLAITHSTLSHVVRRQSIFRAETCQFLFFLWSTIKSARARSWWLMGFLSGVESTIHRWWWCVCGVLPFHNGSMGRTGMLTTRGDSLAGNSWLHPPRPAGVQRRVNRMMLSQNLFQICTYLYCTCEYYLLIIQPRTSLRIVFEGASYMYAGVQLDKVGKLAYCEKDSSSGCQVMKECNFFVLFIIALYVCT